MIRSGDRVAVGVSGGKDSLALLEALLQLQKKAPIAFDVAAFTVEQGKFARPVEAPRRHMRERGVRWEYRRDEASPRLIDEQPGHGGDLCGRYRRRASYEVASELGADVVALGHTADDFCEALPRNALYTGRLSALPAATSSRGGRFRLIRPLVYVNEEITAGYAAERNIPITPRVCSFKTGTVRESLRRFLGETREKTPRVLENLLSAMSRVDTDRLLDRRFLEIADDVEEEPVETAREPFPILVEESV